MLAKLATDAANVAGSMNGDALRASDCYAAGDMARAMDRLADGLAAADYPAAYSGLCQLLANGRKLADYLAESKRGHATCAASLAAADGRLRDVGQAAALSQADATQLRGSPFAAARIARRYLDSYASKAQPVDLASAIDALVQLESEATAKAGEARDATAALHALQSVNAANAEARAKAERQLAEYRSLMAALPLGMARAYPAAFPLLRAYLADAESDS